MSWIWTWIHCLLSIIMSMCDTYLKKIYGWINQCRGEQQKNDANDGMAHTLSSSESEKNQQKWKMWLVSNEKKHCPRVLETRYADNSLLDNSLLDTEGETHKKMNTVTMRSRQLKIKIPLTIMTRMTLLKILKGQEKRRIQCQRYQQQCKKQIFDAYDYVH